MSLKLRSDLYFYSAFFLLATAIGIYFGEGFLDRELFKILSIAQIVAFLSATLVRGAESRFLLAAHLFALMAASLAWQQGHAWLVGFVLGFWFCRSGFSSSNWVYMEYAKRAEQAVKSDALAAGALSSLLGVESAWLHQILWFVIASVVVWFAGNYFYAEHAENHFLFSAAVLAALVPASFFFLPSAFRLQSAVELIKHKIYVKNLEAFDRIEEITSIAFDKTGTLTRGTPEVSQVVSVENVSHQDVLTYAAALEEGIDHPYADAILTRAKKTNLPSLQMKDRVYEGGKGLRAQIQWDNKWQEVCLGNLVWMYENGVEPQDLPENVRWDAEGTDHTVLWLSVDKKVIGAVFLEDPLRSDAVQALKTLADDGYEVGIITGDAENVAQKLLKQLQLKFSHYGVVPQEKITILKRLSEKKKKGFDFIFPKVAFVGDARNEGPALKEAYIGIALGDAEKVKDTPAAVITTRDQIGSISELFGLLKRAESRTNFSKLGLYAYHLLIIALLGYLAWSKSFSSEWVGISALLAMIVQILLVVASRPSIRSS